MDRFKNQSVTTIKKLAIALGAFSQTLGVLGKSIKALSPDTGGVKDYPSATDGVTKLERRKMKKFMSGFAFVAGFLLSNASAALTIKDTRDMVEQGGDVRATIEIWLNGQQDGTSWANIELEQQGRAKLYCQPDKLALTGENVYRLTNDHIKARPFEVDSEWPFEMFVLPALAEAFPCD